MEEKKWIAEDFNFLFFYVQFSEPYNLEDIFLGKKGEFLKI